MADEQKRSISINCIVENLFYKSDIEKVLDKKADIFGNVISRCKYLVCLTDGLYGLEPVWNSRNQFIKFKPHDISSLIPNIDQYLHANHKYEFTICGFHVIDRRLTMFVVFNDKEIGVRNNHYVFMNEDSYDRVYGFSNIDSVVVDGMISRPHEVFTNVESLRTLDSVNIAMTDYGFWDIEKNSTKNRTYSFRGQDKTYRVTDYEGFNEVPDKIIHPTKDLRFQNGQKVVEYDMPWRSVSSETYAGRYDITGDYTNVRYLNKVVGQTKDEHDFHAGTENFAVYAQNGDSPIHILTNMDQTQFNNLFFAFPDLVNTFVRWMYDNSTYEEQSEHYLSTQHFNFVQFLNQFSNQKYDELKYTVSEDDSSLIKADGKFASIKNLLKDHGATDSLRGNCDGLREIFDGDHGFNWLFVDGEDSVTEKIKAHFIWNEYPKNYLAFIQMSLDELVKEHPLLAYFRPYLEEHLKNDYAQCRESNCQIAIDNVSDIIRKVKEYVKGKVMTALILGNYDASLSGNGRYPGIDQYLYQNQMLLRKSDVQDVFSLTKTKEEITAAVRSTPFFSSTHEWEDMCGDVQDAGMYDLFKIATNAGLAEKTGLVDQSTHMIRLEWGSIRDWLFRQDVQTQERILKAFVRTQLYRPQLFKHDNYSTFTSDESLYWCKTKKSYVNHDGEVHDLHFDQDGNIEPVESGMTNDSLGYTINDVKFGQNTNLLEYTVKYDEVQVVDDKFVHDDIEFYVTYLDNPYRRVSCMYLNEFAGATRPDSDRIYITDNKFKIDDVDYVIEDGRVKVNATGVDGEPQKFDDEFCQEIVDGRIKVDGVYYVFHKEKGEWKWLDFAKADDTKLKRIRVATNGLAEYKDGNMKFQFSKDWSRVQIIKDYSVVAMDHVYEEWCVFDDTNVEIDDDRTFEWYLANEVARMKEAYPALQIGTTTLGNGYFYEGDMFRATIGLDVVNELLDGNVTTRARLVYRDENGDVQKMQFLDVLFDRNMNLTRKCVHRGELDSDGVFTETEDGNLAFFLKDVKAGSNNVNAVWMPWTDWENSHSFVEVGSVEYDSESELYRVTWKNDVEVPLPEMLEIQNVFEPGMEYSRSNPLAYSINTTLDGVGRYNVNFVKDVVHLVAAPKGGTEKERYRVDLAAKKVYKLVFKETPV